jgi:hypothetical protein
MNVIDKNPRNMNSLNKKLFKAVKECDIVRCKYLLDLGADVKAKEDAHGSTPLHVASVYGFIDICELLLIYGADMNIKNVFNASPITVATYYGHKNIAKLFTAFEVFTRRQDLFSLMLDDD